MPMPSAQQAAANWARGMQNSTERIRQGVQAVTVSPTERAAAAIPRMVEGIQRAASSGKIERGLRAVTLEDWRRETMEKGIPRVGTGASAAQPKMQQFMGELLPFIESGLGRLNSSTPRGDLGANIARMNEWVNYMAGFRRRS